MKKFIGTKEVEAGPMTMGEAYRRSLLQNGEMLNETNKDAPGYYIKYENGYESWSPKDVFDKVYKCSESFLDRLCIERDNLADKLGKLYTFISSPKFEDTIKDRQQRKLLLKQGNCMANYLNVLNQRIDLLKQ